MGKRRPKKVVKKIDAAGRLRKALAKRTKDELVDILVELVGEDRAMFRRLAAHVELETPPEEIAAATRQAIADATDFDERDINRNFDFDYEAYAEVKRNLGRLIELGELRLAMDLSLELMKQGRVVSVKVRTLDFRVTLGTGSSSLSPPRGRSAKFTQFIRSLRAASLAPVP